MKINDYAGGRVLGIIPQQEIKLQESTSPPTNLQMALDGLNTAANDALAAKIEFVDHRTLPPEEDIALESPKWHRVKGVACLFMDLVGSSQIDYQNKTEIACRVYQTFTGNLVSTWRMFGASFYDIKGDGGFALFDGDNAPTRAFLAAETFRTSVSHYVREKVLKETENQVTIRAKTAISFGDVAVKRVGARGRYNHNLVWLDSTINQAAKLLASADGEAEEILASEAAYKNLDHDKIRWSCGCNNGGKRSPLWKSREVPDLASVGIKTAYFLTSLWCKTHGADYYRAIVDNLKVKEAEAV